MTRRLENTSGRLNSFLKPVILVITMKKLMLPKLLYGMTPLCYAFASLGRTASFFLFP